MDKNEMLRVLVAERASLIGFILSVIPDREVAEDVFQTLVIITSERGPVVETRERLLAWARTVARHEVGRTFRERRRTVVLDDGILDQLEGRWSAQDRSAAQPLDEALRRCLDRLNPNTRGMLRLRFEKSMSGEELARALGRTVNTVYVALSRTYRTLARCIEAEGSVVGRLRRTGE